MTNFLKRLYSKNFILFLVLIFGFILRFYNFPERITFGPEQAISLITSGNMIKEKFSLLGQENVQRLTSTGHKIYSGAFFSYSLIPLQLIFNYDPLLISAYFALLNIFTSLILYYLARKIYGDMVAFFALVLFIFNFLMIYHSLFIWILNYFPLIGVLIFYFLICFLRKRDFASVFWIGILSGIGFSLEYTFAIYFPIILFFIFKFGGGSWIKKLLIFVIASIIPNIPFLFFEVRHGFYQTHTLFIYAMDLVSGRAFGVFHYYNFLPVLPILFIVVGVLLDKLRKNFVFLPYFILILYIFFNLRSPLINFSSPTGMPKDLTISNIREASGLIAGESLDNFNVAVINDFDTRGHILRYFLTFIYKKEPMGVEDYPYSDVLYVLAERDYDFRESDVWEIGSGGFKRVAKISDIGSKFSLFKLSRDDVY